VGPGADVQQDKVVTVSTSSVQRQGDLFLSQRASGSCVPAVGESVGKNVAQIRRQGLDSLVEGHARALVVGIGISSSNHISTAVDLWVHDGSDLHAAHGASGAGTSIPVALDLCGGV